MGRACPDADIRAWCAACHADALAPDLIAQVRSAETLYREWRRQARSGLRKMQDDSLPLWARTTLFRVHEHWSVPGIFQTAAYSMASMQYWSRLLDLPNDQDAANAVRMGRQRILRDGSRRFVFALAEQVLYTRVGSVETMLEQLDRISAVMAMPNVSIGVIPAMAGLGAHTQTAFWMFDDSLVQIETLTAGIEVTRAEEIEIYLTAFDELRAACVVGKAAKNLIARAQNQLLQ